MNRNLNIPMSFPPLPEEYGYFYNKQDYECTYIVKCESGNNIGCHFSSKEKISDVPFLTCHGKIISIDKIIKK